MTAVSSTKVALQLQQEMSVALPATPATPSARAHILRAALRPRTPLQWHVQTLGRSHRLGVIRTVQLLGICA